VFGLPTCMMMQVKTCLRSIRSNVASFPDTSRSSLPVGKQTAGMFHGLRSESSSGEGDASAGSRTLFFTEKSL